MPELLRTTEDGKDPHYHILYLREDGTGITSIDGKDPHPHEFIYQEPQEEIVDQDPNSPTFNVVIQEAVEGGWFIVPDNDHEHELEEYATKSVTKKLSDGKLVTDIAQRYLDSQKLEEDSRESGYEAEEFYSHKQWDNAKKRELESKDRAALTINKIEEKIDNLTGYQRQNRTDIKFLATENGDERVADILNIVVKHDVLEKCSYGREESKVFEDGAIIGRGLFHIFDDFEKNIQGDIMIEKYKWDEGTCGEHEKEDLSDCEVIFKEKWYSITKLREMYPDKEEEFQPEQKDRNVRTDDIAEDWDKRLNAKEFINTVTKQYKVITCERKVFKRVFVLINANDEFSFDADGWKENDLSRAKTIPGFYKIPRVTCSVRVSKIASTTLLEDDMLEGPDEDEFSLVPLYAKYRNNEFWGKVEAVKDLQILINKSYSQFVDILNKCANYGWFYDAETFPTKKEKDNFKRNASSSGFLSQVNDTNKLPKQVEGVKFPVELVNAITMFNQDMREIMNVNLDMQGMGQGDSGIAMRMKIVQQLVGNDFLFDNMSFAKKKLGQIIVKKIAKLYTPQRIMRIVANQHQRAGEEGITINGQPFDQIDQDAITRILEDTDLTQYDVVVSESASSPSAMMGNFLALLELAGKGIPIPPEAIMIYAPIPDKTKVMAAIANSQQQAQAAEDKKYDTELEKTKIAAGAKTDEGSPPDQVGRPPGGPPLG
ncbi:hypothetical protein KAR91_58115 [Candidatus Pacearchaeota archaeon]|nr:hypothetical protein [Candidatus Pacearchaeota archaeon]